MKNAQILFLKHVSFPHKRPLFTYEISGSPLFKGVQTAGGLHVMSTESGTSGHVLRPGEDYLMVVVKCCQKGF